jgi:predicted AlkP superfamily phosphohydrolase/phosphomutase
MAEIYGFVQMNLGPAHPRKRRELAEELKDRFGQVTDPHSGGRLFTQVLEGDSIYDGHTEPIPDLVLVPAEGWTVLRELRNGSYLVPNKAEHLGTHRRQGIFVADGPSIRSLDAVSNLRIIDMAPTILHLLGLPVASDMDGRVLEEILKTQRPTTHTDVESYERREEWALSEEEKDALENRLRALGYLG